MSFCDAKKKYFFSVNAVMQLGLHSVTMYPVICFIVLDRLYFQFCSHRLCVCVFVTVCVDEPVIFLSIFTKFCVYQKFGPLDTYCLWDKPKVEIGF